MVDVAHDGDDRRPRAERRPPPLLVVLLEVAGLQLGLLLLAGVDEPDLGTELGREQLDHVVGQRLGGRDHLALEEEEADHVAGRAVELRPELAGGRAPLDDDLAVGHRGVRRRVGRDLGRLELFEVATTAPGPTLRWTTPTRALREPGGGPPPAGPPAPERPCEPAARATAEATATAGRPEAATTRGTAAGAWRVAAPPGAGPEELGAPAAGTPPGGGGIGRPEWPTGRPHRRRRDRPARSAERGSRRSLARRAPTSAAAGPLAGGALGRGSAAGVAARGGATAAGAAAGASRSALLPGPPPPGQGPPPPGSRRPVGPARVAAPHQHGRSTAPARLGSRLWRVPRLLTSRGRGAG